MKSRQRRWGAVLVLLLGLLAPSSVTAGPYIGDWSWCWKPAKDCPRGDYCFLHYWTPQIYPLCYFIFPRHLDQYPPGLGIPPGYQLDLSPCRARPPVPNPAYADPAAYYGRQIVPPDTETTDKK